MFKKSLIFCFFIQVLNAQQLVTVIAPELNSTHALLQRYEKKTRWEKVGEQVPVVLGRAGLGYSGVQMPQKNEGDGRSPLGLFDIDATFGYSKETNSTMPYYHANDKLICIDDTKSRYYNKMALLNSETPPISFEFMHRNDGVYRYGAVISYNQEGVAGRGSCIFFHLNNTYKKPTSGCTAMDETPLLELLQWLDPTKKPKLLQIPSNECLRYQQEFQGITCPL